MKKFTSGYWMPLILITLFSFNYVRGNSSDGIPLMTPAYTTEDMDEIKAGLRNWLTTVLELEKNIQPNDASNNETYNEQHQRPLRAPQYVQKLYDRVALENDDQPTFGRHRRSINGGSYNFGAAGGTRNKLESVGPITIQAIARDENSPTSDTNRMGYTLQFCLEKLWIPNQDLRLAELVLAVDYARLMAPPGSYSVYAYTVDDAAGTQTVGSRLLVSAGSLSVLDTFGNNFVQLNVTEPVIRKVMAGGRRAITLQIFVECKQPNGNEVIEKRDLIHQEIGDLFHLSSHGSHQPLLVIYSSTAESIGERIIENHQSRRRRSITASNRATAFPQPAGTNTECMLHEWWVEFADLIREVIIKPDGFSANYCGGRCRFPMYDPRLNATGNASIRGVFNAYWRQRNRRNGSNQTSAIPDAHCVTQSTAPITILYKVGDNFVIKTLFDMVARSCRCA